MARKKTQTTDRAPLSKRQAQSDYRGRRLPVSWCPDCGYGPMDSATGLEKGTKPSPGSLSLCIRCGSFLQYDETMHLVIVTAAEMRDLPEDIRAKLHQARRVIHQVNAEKKDEIIKWATKNGDQP